MTIIAKMLNFAPAVGRGGGPREREEADLADAVWRHAAEEERRRREGLPGAERLRDLQGPDQGDLICSSVSISSLHGTVNSTRGV